MTPAASVMPLEETQPVAGSRGPAPGLAVIDRSESAAALLDVTRRRILKALEAPGSATSVSAAAGVSRQLANYHIRALEKAGLVEEVGRRKRRGLEERLVRATATRYVLSPETLGRLGADAGEVRDRFSASYQVAMATRTIREVAALAGLARSAGKRLTTLSLETEVRFASPGTREAFARDLTAAVERLVARYHDASAKGGRAYRLFLGAHPVHRAPGSRTGRS